MDRDDAMSVAKALGSVPGVRRVLVCNRDGIAIYDDLALEQREQAAASSATLMGVAAAVSQTLHLGHTEGAIVMGRDATVIARALEAPAVLVAIVDADASLNEVYRVVRKQGRVLDEAIARSAAIAVDREP